MRKVYIAGVGFTKIGDHWKKGISDLAIEAVSKALACADKVKPDRIVVGNMLSSVSSKQLQLGSFLSSALGFNGLSAYTVEAGGASGAAAAHVGFQAVASGESDAVLVVGAEKPRDIDPTQLNAALSMAENYEYIQLFGITSTAIWGMLARLYMREYDIGRDRLSAFPILAHQNALTAEHAQFRKKIGVEDVARSGLVADPLRLLDCSPVGDGAAALLLVSDSYASNPPLVELSASVVATSGFNFAARNDMLFFMGSKGATAIALEKAGVYLRDLDLVELHDECSVSAALVLEAMGISKRGSAPHDASQGRFNLGGELPICTFGGLKGRGHPTGATGLYQLSEAYLQLIGKAGSNQVKDAEIALTHSMGGVDSTAVVHVLRRTT